MFEGLFSKPRPWLFGQIYLPGGSQHLGNAAYSLTSGSRAPLIGVLMEVTRAVRLRDGKFLILATAISRIKVGCSMLPEHNSEQQQWVCDQTEYPWLMLNSNSTSCLGQRLSVWDLEQFAAHDLSITSGMFRMGGSVWLHVTLFVLLSGASAHAGAAILPC